jgi:uncharacterized membrane protein
MGSAKFGRLPSAQGENSDTLETVMQRVSLIVSLVALGFMVGGLVVTLSQGVPLTAATTALPVSEFRRITRVPLGLATMSAGIIMLAVLPSMRVVVALWLYIRRHQALEALVALIVLLELLLSMRLGG